MWLDPNCGRMCAAPVWRKNDVEDTSSDSTVTTHGMEAKQSIAYYPTLLQSATAVKGPSRTTMEA